jgi:uncharacterized membrane protein
VRKHLLDLILLFVLTTIVTGYVAVAQPRLRDVTVHVYVLLVGGLLMLGIVAAAGDAVPSRRRSELDRALAEAKRPDKPLQEVERLEREVTLACATAYDLHVRLVPHLREIAQARLARQGKRLAPEHVGPWWDLLRPDREAPDDRFSPGISERDLRALVDDLERM